MNTTPATKSLPVFSRSTGTEAGRHGGGGIGRRTDLLNSSIEKREQRAAGFSPRARSNRENGTLPVGRTCSAPRFDKWYARISALGLIGFVAVAGCGTRVGDLTGANPFEDLPAIRLDGRARSATADLVPLGLLQEGQVIGIDVAGGQVETVFVLVRDERVPDAGTLVGGGRPGSPFHYRIPEMREYYLYLQFNPLAAPERRRATVAVGAGDPGYRPPARQVVQVVFAPDYLTGPGLFDPLSGTEADRVFLDSISAHVRDEIVAYLRGIFLETPVQIFTEADVLPDGPVSRLLYLPDRVIASDQEIIDAALPPPDPTRPECQIRVTFGEMLPRGTKQDPGNSRLDDEAAVYVGSFQGRGETCRTAILDSVNAAVLTLAQAGAHEIGHLVGLYHVEQIQIMNRAATMAFQRELDFGRGQVQIERLIGEQIVAEVFPAIVQEPEVYWRFAFDWAPAP